ncbi:uncharacterized protein LOC111339133 [Stylophora pistillata]|uniref:uncharacterized protein LOC111339133 n=1 Tax=Stylophora pistillata TaxID=50429 RepID=UPI000C051C34|nr:uncharacterized protein LOC111339133 [Stylophora pistillata]
MLIPLACENIAIEKEEGCPYDYMEILEGDGLSSTVIERHCGVLNRSVTVERNGSLSIRFVSHKDKENKGFRCSYNIVRGTSSVAVGTQLHSLVLKTSSFSFSLKTDVSSSSAKIDTLSLTLSNSGLNTVAVHSSQQTISITTLASPSSSRIDSRIFLITEIAGLVTPISQEIQATVSLLLPFRKDSKTPLIGETY